MSSIKPISPILNILYLNSSKAVNLNTEILYYTCGRDAVYADQDPSMATKYEIRQAPSLVVETNGETEKIVNLSNIKKYIEQSKDEG